MTTSYNFEQFKNVGGSYAAKVSIRNNGSFGFSQGALRRFGLDDGKWFFTLHYDKTARVIGLRPTQDEKADGVVRLQCRPVVSKGRTSLTAQVSARAFFDYYGIDYKGPKKTYVPVKDEAHGMIIIDLTKPREGDNEEEEPF